MLGDRKRYVACLPLPHPFFKSQALLWKLGILSGLVPINKLAANGLLRFISDSGLLLVFYGLDGE